MLGKSPIQFSIHEIIYIDNINPDTLVLVVKSLSVYTCTGAVPDALHRRARAAVAGMALALIACCLTPTAWRRLVVGCAGRSEPGC